MELLHVDPNVREVVPDSYHFEVPGLGPADEEGNAGVLVSDPFPELGAAILGLVDLVHAHAGTWGPLAIDRVRIIQDPSRNVTFDIRGAANVNEAVRIWQGAIAASDQAEALTLELDKALKDLDQAKKAHKAADQVKELQKELDQVKKDYSADTAALKKQVDTLSADLDQARKDLAAAPKTTVKDNRGD